MRHVESPNDCLVLKRHGGMITALSAKRDEGCVSVSMWHHHPCSRSPLSLPLWPNLLSMARVLKTVFFFLELSTCFLSLLPCGACKSANYPKLENAIFRFIFSSSLGDQPPKSPLFCPYRLRRAAQVLLVSLPTPASRQRSIHLVRVYVLSLFPGTRISSPT